jgi:repressor LexA
MRWENGDIENMKRDKIVSLSEALKISPAVIMGWEDIEEPEVAKVDVFINELKDITSDANEATKRAILDYAYFALERQKKGGIAHVTEEN